jgi:hypothetical protein
VSAYCRPPTPFPPHYCDDNYGFTLLCHYTNHEIITLLRFTPSRDHCKFDFVMLSQMRTHIKSWWQQTPLPTTTATPNFQKWHNFDQGRWMPFVSDKTSRPGIRHQWAGSFRLVSWNVNADVSLPKSRMSALLRVIKTTGAADVVFLQEVSREALTALLEESWTAKLVHKRCQCLRFWKPKVHQHHPGVQALGSHRWYPARRHLEVLAT